MAYEIDKRLMELNVRDLPLNRRQQLSSYLNVEQILMSDCGFARDYRGIAQQLNLSYSEIAQLEKLFDPCGTLLNYQQCSKLTVFNLFELLLTIGRYDILDDMIPIILDDIENNQNIHDNDDNEQCSSLALKPIIPIENESRILYDAYVCYADSDINFVRNLAEHLESPSIGFRLFIRDRDLLVGNWVYETFTRLIETQCRRMIIILSPEFLQSHDCKFQSMFAAGLAIEKCQRILIPVIYKQCETIPSLLRLLSKIDMSNHRLTNNNNNNNDTIPEWSMKRLIMSIKPEKQYQENNRLIEIRNNEPLIEYNDDDNDNHTNPNNNNQRLKMIENTKTQISVISNNDNIVDNDDDQQLLSTTHLISTDNQPKNLQNSTKIPTNNTNNRSKNWLKSIKKKIKVVL